MNKNLLSKLALIVGILIVFLFGIFGIPQSFSGQGLLTAMTNRIHLGLDLRGGTHLILQVQVNDAVNIDSDNAVEILKRFPASGRPGRVAGTRELVVSRTPYIVPYRVRDDTVELLLVLHAARKWPSQF